MENCLPWVEAMLEREKSVRSPPLEEQGAETMCDELTATPILHLPALAGERRKRIWK